MKQRLLLALLVLFASVGMVQASDELTLTIPADATAKGSVMITATGTGASLTYPAGTSGTTITIKQTVNKQSDVKISASGCETITISGKVTSCTLGLAGVKTLTFSNNGELETLDVTNSNDLTTIKVDGKLKSITQLPNACKVMGKQTVDASTVTASAKGIDILDKASSFLGTLPSSGDYTFTWEKWDETNLKYVSATSEAKKILTNVGNYAFTDNNNYYTSGTYKCTVKRGDASVALEGIKITPALITIKVKESPKNGWDKVMGSILNVGGITVKDCAVSTGNTIGHTATAIASTDDMATYECHQGDKISVTATPASANYLFSEFVKSEGLVGVQPTDGSTVTTFEVKAKATIANPSVSEDVTIQAVFKGKPCKIDFGKEDLNGSFFIQDVTDKSKTIDSGASVEYGHKLMITAKPNDKFYAKYLVGGEDPENIEVEGVSSYKPNTTNDDFKTNNIAYVYVDGNRNITVQFIPNATTSTNYTFNLVAPSTATNWDDVFASIQFGNEDVTLGSNSIGIGTAITQTTTTPLSADQNNPMVIIIKNDAKYIVQSVQMGTQSLTITSEGSQKYSTSFRAPQDGDAVFTITVVGLKDITVDFEGKEANSADFTIQEAQVYQYDKTGKSFKYTTTPANLELKVMYKEYDATNDAAYTTVKPIHAGFYAVKYSRDADSQYSAIAETKVTIKSQNGNDANKVIEIQPANVQIEKLPTVTAVKQSDNTYKYKIGIDGVAKSLGEVVSGTFEIVTLSLDKVADPSEVKGATATEIVPGTTSATSHNAVLRFQVKNGTTINNDYYSVATVIPVKVGTTDFTTHKVVLNPKIVSVDGSPVSSNIPSVTTEIYNGANKITGDKIVDGTYIKLRAIVDGYAKVEFKDTKLTNPADKEAKWVSGNIYETDAFKVEEDWDFSIALTQKLDKVFSMNAKTQSVVYSGEAKEYDVTQSDLVVKQKDVDKTTDWKFKIYYKDEKGNIVKGAPVNAGEYSVCIDIPMNVDGVTPENSYAAQTLEVKGALQITKKDPKMTWPTSVSMIGKGQKLSAATFLGGSADIAGAFTWKKDVNNPESGQYYDILFTPSSEYQNNYSTLTLTAEEQKTGNMTGLAVSISADPVVSIATVQNGKFVVKAGDTEYHTGNLVKDGTTLTITAVPNDGFQVKSLSIDEVGTNHSISSGATFKINGKSIYVTGEFELKSAVDPNTQYTVTLPAIDAVKGVIINKPGVNAVKKEASFAFTLSSLAADAANIVVKVDGTTITPVDGTYTIAKVDGNKTISVALANPTKIKVVVEKETRNAGKHLMGKVEVEGLAKDSTCYYGDEVTIVAFPESGVTFDGWSGSITGKEKLATFIVKEAMKITPKFSGVPTGIEEIEGINIHGADGYIFISCNGAAQATIVSMDGRSRTIEVSGETRIQESAGLYGVVLVKGSQVIKKKVIVR